MGAENKSPGDLEGRMGSMINVPDRRRAVELIKEAICAGSSAQKACEGLEISLRTYKRWTDDGEVETDGRPEAERPEPANKLKPEERQRILEICNEKEYQSLPPSQIVPALCRSSPLTRFVITGSPAGCDDRHQSDRIEAASIMAMVCYST
jgi:hypothetical protein